jgi:hypothetical protein
MKKLGKLSINPEKVMKNEELVNLRGGYGIECVCGTYHVLVNSSDCYEASNMASSFCGGNFMYCMC